MIDNANIIDLVSVVVGASGILPLAVERLHKRGIDLSEEELLSTLASDPQAPELLSRQFKVKATLSTYQIMMLYQAAMIEQVSNDEVPLRASDTIAAFTAASTLFSSLTQTAGQQLNVNVFDRILASVNPEVREALTILAVKDEILDAPTPIRKRGRPPGSHTQLIEGAH